ncbi:extracellular solute-binding protein [Paenibacillus beijingensis]|uniref:ABC transporter substrate-binding protein n=1 Tax=Paenibacillus beijingensis TaxID=1126833 RepID=A0A0D5NPZ7_9BACL|nr:extracellular solute-binding protein [Paenibacillus beijingensis]AJY77331.1 hypothetical protein VN24_25685 [Paenibacillus beijingensis]
MCCRWLTLLLILVLTAGCGSPSVITDPNNVQKLHEQEETVVTFWNTYSDKEAWLLERELIPAFERENPGIRVESKNLVFNNELKNTLIARASSSRGPDVVRMSIDWVPEFSHKGLLVPLNGFPGFDQIRSRFDPKIMDVGLYKNDYYSLPLNLYTKVAIFNRNLLKKAGYTNPPRTMEEVLRIARQHRYTIGIDGFWSWETLLYIYSLGGSLTDEKISRSSGYLNSEETVHAVELLKALYKEKLLVVSSKSNNGERWSRIQAGNMLMIDEGPWFYSLLNKAELERAEKLTVSALFPHRDGFSSIIGGENMVIMKGSKRQAEAWTFMKWLTSKEAQLFMAQTGLIPSNREAAKAWSVSRNSYLHPFAEAVNNSFLRPPVNNWGKIDEVYFMYLKKIFQGELSVKTGLDIAAAKIDKLLAEANSGH